MLRAVIFAGALTGLLVASGGCSQSASDARAEAPTPEEKKGAGGKEPEKKSDADPVEERAVELVVKRLEGKVTRDEKLPGKPVVGVDLSSTRATDADLKELLACRKLASLKLYGTRHRATVAGLKQLAAIETLSELNIDNWKLTDEQLKELTVFKNLTSLHFSTEQLTEAGWKELGSFKKLTSLRLTGRLTVSESRQEGLEHLAALTNLTSLQLIDVPVKDAGMKELVALKNLTSLTLFGCLVSEVGLKELAAFKKLRSLTLGGQVTGKGLRELAAVPMLSELIVRYPLPEEDIEGVLAIKALTRLVLAGSLLTDKGLEKLTALENLTELDVTVTYVTAAGVEKFQKARPKCKVVR